MKINLSALHFSQACLACLLILSCESESENEVVVPDFSINSTNKMDIISTYDNGWIKEAVKKDGLGNTEIIFEYHENGYIQSCKIYEPWPDHYLFAELERDEYNLPISARYYYPDGGEYLTITYKNGEILSKTIISEEGNLTEFNYDNGRILSVEKSELDNNNVTVVDYDYEAKTRTLKFMNSGSIISEEELPFPDDLGCGISTNEDLMLSNYFVDESIKEEQVLKSLGNSLTWESTVDPLKIIPAPVVYDKWSGPRTKENDIRFIAEGSIYRSVAEQYPFAESKVLVSGHREISNRYYVYPEISIREELGDLLSQGEAEFTKHYGDEYYYEQFLGNFQLNIGVLRNLPSDAELRAVIEGIAKKHMSFLISGKKENEISSEEEGLLSKVFFEVKVHSPTLDDINGVIITSHQDYSTVEELILNAENIVVQKGFKKYSAVALNP